MWQHLDDPTDFILSMLVNGDHTIGQDYYWSSLIACMPGVCKKANENCQNRYLKVHWCRFENLSICLCSYKNTILKVSHSESKEFSSYSPVNSVFFLKSRLIFNVFYCFCMFVNKHFAYLYCAYLKRWKVLKCTICVVLIFIWRWMHCKIFMSALVYL